ncbi:MAG: 16S rRNA (adenine(1518)-N(6)/adenine(1519)-N(6))-dimethyltransferase RsmA [Aggregatilineales bacterium]
MNPKTLLDTHAIDPKKSLGQNFLHDPNALHKIVTAAELAPDDTVLEIGAGTGALTAQLAEGVPDGRVVAVEIDDRLLPILNRTLVSYPNVELVCADILKTNAADLVGTSPYSVVANLPYYITSAILRHLLEAEHKPRRLVLTVQEEVAERLSARPGDMSVLAVSVQFYGRPYIVTRLGAAAFWPRPDVGSAVVRIDVYEADQRPVDAHDEALFFRIVRAGFGQKRKQLKNSLSAGLALSPGDAGAWLEQAGIDPMRRAETLTLTEWGALCRTINF